MDALKLGANNTTLGSTPQEYQQCFFLPEPEFNLVWSERYTTNLITALINFALIPFAITANLFVILAITKNNSLHTPSLMLLSCLAFSDFLIGLIVQPLYGTFRLMENTHLYVPCAFRVVYSESFWVCYGVSFVTLSALSCERYLGLRLHLRYGELVTTKGVLQVVIAIWIGDVLLTSLQWVGDGSFVRNLQIAIFILCLLVTCFAHFKIFRIIRRHQRQIIEQNSANQDSNASHSNSYLAQKKLAKNITYIVGFYLVFNMPVLIVQMHQFAGGTISSLNVFSWVETIAFAKSSVNPVICGWRNKEIRQGMAKILRKCLYLEARTSNHEDITEQRSQRDSHV
ncbi:melanocyte-stimulating hormone receptor-like [Actinia tenebrosa]|uniref:Melanocyte-stimulating hormone receptor-like n=1 Tax=Actinia tenebrosa TaxID=6105 RepID=A0A6P8IFG9_ACTTE|nr:melanocyte-stimulating hormone receptor-like [Actinia tenebrosa]